MFAANALSPAKVNQVRITDIENRQMEVIVNEDQLSLAIGKRGQNVRLATKLVGWNIDIRSEEELKKEVAEQMGALIASGGSVPLSAIEGVRIIGTAREKLSVLSFTIDSVHPHDIGTILDQQGIAVRAGHHCAQPVMKHFNVPATARASFAFYNTKEEADRLAEAIEKVIEVFS